MIFDLTSCIMFKKGIRTNLALNILKKNNIKTTKDNIDQLLKANDTTPFPHIGSIFEVLSKIPGKTEEIKKQIISKLYDILEKIEKELEENIVIPDKLTKEGE